MRSINYNINSLLRLRIGTYYIYNIYVLDKCYILEVEKKKGYGHARVMPVEYSVFQFFF